MCIFLLICLYVVYVVLLLSLFYNGQLLVHAMCLAVLFFRHFIVMLLLL